MYIKPLYIFDVMYGGFIVSAEIPPMFRVDVLQASQKTKTRSKCKVPPVHDV